MNLALKFDKRRLLYYLVLLSLVIYIANCKISLVPTYDVTLDQRIETAAKETDRLYLGMLAADSMHRTYEEHSDNIIICRDLYVVLREME